MSFKIQYSKLCLLLLGGICAGAFLIRAEGIKWPKLHPDEHVIGLWIEQSAQHIYIKDRVYPNGFFALARPFVWLDQARIHITQHVDYYCNTIDRIRDVKTDGVYLGRWFNVIAGTLVCLPMFLLVLRITRSARAGLFAAGLIGFAQYAVEHSHYAETDIAALLVLTLVLWLWVVAGDTLRLRWFVAAALLSGFAAGTKFTLTVLGPLVLVEAVLLAQRRGPTGWWKPALGLTGLGLLLFGAGFALANPAVLLAPNWFWAGLAAEKQRVFAETALNLGPLGAQPAVQYLQQFLELNVGLKTLGYPWVILVAAGLPLTVFGFARRYGTILFLLPLMYAVYWLFLAPWVRSQEFLFFLPSFAALAALPLVALWRAKNVLGRVFVLIIAVTALAVSGHNSLRVSSLFGWQDTRYLAWEWLHPRLALDSKLAAEFYAEKACVNTWKNPLFIRKIEQIGLEALKDEGVNYLLRTPGIGGRGLWHPLTGKLYSEPARHLQQFLAGSELLCAWAPLSPPGLATFISPPIELYGLKHFKPIAALTLDPAQPVLIVNSDQNPMGRQTFFPIGHKLGCATGLLIDRLPQTIAVGGPLARDQSVFLVLNTAERPAVIDVRGFGLSKKIALEPYDTAVVPLKRSKWRFGQKLFETITLQAEPVKDVLYIPCFARIVFTADEAARICLDTERADRLGKYFPAERLEKELSPAIKYIMATRLGRWTLADQIEQQAMSLRSEIEKCQQIAPSAVAINGCSGYYYEQFARARLQQWYNLACLLSVDQYDRVTQLGAIKILDLQLPPSETASEKIGQALQAQQYDQMFSLPILIAHGQYELRGEVMLRLQGRDTTSAVPFIIRPVPDGVESAWRRNIQPDQWHEFSLVLRPEREIQPQLVCQLPCAARVYLKNMEICWSLSNVLEAVGSDLALAAGRHSVQRADWKKATAQLAVLQAKKQTANELEIRQMLFLCAGGLQDDAGRMQAARSLLELAPNHYRGLLALAAGDELAGKKVRQMEGNLTNPPVFAPWLALVSFAFNPATRETRCVFEALRDNTPALAVTFWIQDHGKWRRKQVQALTAGARLNKGERVAAVVRLNDDLCGSKPDVNKLALGVETDVLWHASAIPVAGGGYTVPFTRLGALSRQLANQVIE